MFVTKCFSDVELTTPNLLAQLDDLYRTLLSYAPHVTGTDFTKDMTPVVSPWGSDIILTGEGWWYRKCMLLSPTGPVNVASVWEEIPRDRDAITLLSNDSTAMFPVDVWVEVTNVPGPEYLHSKTSVATALATLKARRIPVQKYVGRPVSEMPVREIVEEFVLRMGLKNTFLTTQLTKCS